MLNKNRQPKSSRRETDSWESLKWGISKRKDYQRYDQLSSETMSSRIDERKFLLRREA